MSFCAYSLRPLVLAGAILAAVPALAADRAPSANPFGEQLTLIFADEFDGERLDPTIWKSQAYEQGLSRETARGPDNLEVRDGELRLHVRKEARPAGKRVSTWTAGYVYTCETVENNVLIEARFKPGQTSGVNNAFWLTSVGADRSGVRNRYEIDVVETRLDPRAAGGHGRGHLAWHDWKTYGYAKNARGDSDHIAQGVHVEHSWEEFHTWALWLGEHETIYYLDGREVWRGTTHPRYTDQYRTGVGKLPHWYPDRERDAYGKFGQPDWSYFGGYAGDKMNIVFSNLPWPETWTPLTDAAHGTYMAVDYVRVFRPQRLLTREPVVHQLADSALALGPNAPDRDVTLPSAVPLATAGRWPAYFSFVATLGEGAKLAAEFVGADGVPLFTLTGAARELQLGFGDARVSTATAFPSNERLTPWLDADRPMLWLARVTPANDLTGGAAVSWCVLPLDAVPEREPYFHANIDPAGNTSRNNGWQLNAKGGAVEGAVHAVRFRVSGRGNASVRALKAGPSYLSVLP